VSVRPRPARRLWLLGILILFSPLTAAAPSWQPHSQPRHRGRAPRSVFFRQTQPNSGSDAIPTSPTTPAPSPTAPVARHPAHRTPEISLLFAGDITPPLRLRQAKAANDMALPYRALAGLLQAADIAITAWTARCPTTTRPARVWETTRNLMAPAEAAQGLRSPASTSDGSDHHIKDCGLIRGCINTRCSTHEQPPGAGHRADRRGGQLAEATTPPSSRCTRSLRFTAYWPSTHPSGRATRRPAQCRSRLKSTWMPFAAPRQCRCGDCAAALGPGVFSRHLVTSSERPATAMVNAGATLVIGNHPHHVQGVETFPNGAVAAYSLGNFVFDRPCPMDAYTIQGIMLRANFRGSQITGIELVRSNLR